MMPYSSDKIWLTSALTDSDVNGALTLGFSLRRVLTCQKLGVIISSNVSTVLRRALHYCFDLVINLDPELNTVGLENEEFVKVFALTLKSFQKIVMFSPMMMVVQNCDELLDSVGDDSTQPFMWTKEGDNFTLIVYPSFRSFEGVMKGLSGRNGTPVNVYLTEWLHNQVPNCNYIQEKYNNLVHSETGLLCGNGNEVSIVNLRDSLEHWLEASNKSAGFISKGIFELWKRIQDEKVRPLLAAVSNPISGVPIEGEPTENNEKIAIIGMSCRYPASNNLEEFWEILASGKDATGNPPPFRWLNEQCSEKMKPEYLKTNAGFLKCSVDDFDAKFFNISPKEVVCLDPQHRLLHEVVWEGLEDAAINPHSLEGTNGGVFIGSWLNDYKDILRHDGNDEFYRMYMGTSIGAGAARISHLLGLTGPSIATESGCSSAMVAVHLACKSLKRRETNIALACGVNLLLHPFDKDVMPMVISPDGHCKTFDAKADGFARGEGCGVLVLKRLSDAVRDGDKVWAVIGGTGMTQEGVSKSMGTPTIHCESLAMKEALEDARVDPALVSYVEAHGTGTVVGDPMEIAAIAKAYHSKVRKEPLLIGSVKTNVGHTESCSGITGIMKVVLALQHEMIPPHRNFDTINPAIDLEAVPAKIPLEPVSWPKQDGKPRLAGVSSFGITGTDAHVIIEESPKIPSQVLTFTEFERPLHLMKISAKTDEALDILLERYKSHLATSDEKFTDLAHAANIGRADFTQRAVILAKSKEDAVTVIEQNKMLRGEEAPETIGKVCFLFTGQGSQYPGMAKQLYETSPVFRIHFDHCDNILKNTYNIDITQILWSNASSNEISRTIYSQTSIFCVEYALLKLWESWGVKADYALGHSLGEFAAAVCAGILSVDDAIKLVAERSRLIDELPRGKMLVIKADKQRVDTLMKTFAANDKNKILDYAAINSLEQTVLAGDSDLILEFSQLCKNSNLKCIVLEATHAFHSKHMEPMLGAYRTVAKTVKHQGGNACKYISGMRGTLLDIEDVNAEYWVEHTREKVMFLNASKEAVQLECKTFIEIGPQPVLSALTMMNNDVPLSCFPSMKRNEKEWDTLLNTLGQLYLKGVEINWKGVDQFYERKKVSLPHYPFIKKKYWKDLISSTGSTIHPLIGSVIPNASSTKLFQNGLNLRDVEYVKDHVIGDNVIFPGAGYLEMCLAAGLATVEGSTDTLVPPTRPMKVENLMIQAPLCLNESKASQIQTVVELNMSSEDQGDWNDMKIRIVRRIDAESTKWLPHAVATFSPIPTAEEKIISFDITRFIEIQKKPSNDESLQQIYEKLASVGLKFGPIFRSVEKVWRDEEKCTLLAKVKVPSEENSAHANYIVHPVLLDAMIQAIMMLHLTSNIKKKLWVPIKIGKFIWLSSPPENSIELFIHAFDCSSNNSSTSAFLLNSKGKILGVMSSVEFIDTTVKSIDSVLEQQTSSMPGIWEEIWKSQPGSLEHRLNSLKTRTTSQQLNLISDDFNTLPEHTSGIFEKIEKLVYLNMLRCLYECGWKPILGETISEEELRLHLQIHENNRQYFGFMLEVLEMEGLLEKASDFNLAKKLTWKLINMPPSQEQVEATLRSPTFTSDLVSCYSTTPLFIKVGENLSKIMSGTQPALNILFPEETKGYPSVAEFYTTYEKIFEMKKCVASKFTHKLSHTKNMMEGEKYVVRVLEIGAGTGSFTENALEAAERTGTEFEYTYTDISAAFFPAAEKKFEKYKKHMKFMKLNIEEDPIEQGFIPEYFDYVVASDVIHATKDIAATLKNIRMLMRPYGVLELQEMTKVHRFVTFVFGLLDGFWRFEDLELRPRHCTLSAQDWTRVLNSSGFEVDAIFPMVNNYHSYFWAVRTPQSIQFQNASNPKDVKSWLLFQPDVDNSQIVPFIKAKLEARTGRRGITVHAGNKFELRNQNGTLSFTLRRDVEGDFICLLETLKSEQINLEGILYAWSVESWEGVHTQDQLLRPYFYLTKSLLTTKLPGSPRLIGLTSGAIPIGDVDMSNFAFSTLWGYTKSLKNENHGMTLKFLDVETGLLKEKQLEEIFGELWNIEKDLALAHRNGMKFVAKMQSHKPMSSPISLPKGTDRFQLLLPETKSISDLQFGTLDAPLLREDEVEVHIKASALNFRDVLSVIKPTEQFKDINAVGFDFAGVVKRVGGKVTKWKVGDKVSGCNMANSALPSHATLHQDLLIPLPHNMTFCEAATIPAVYVTSVACLIETAKIKKGDVVLLHTATGGVGLSAIEICKHVGCTIIATAGSKRKQNYLRSLGIQHIFHSRNTHFADEILKVTSGRGVDVILNSLTSEGFKEATLKACAKGARFIEMSKLNIWKEEDVKELRPDVKYTIVDVSSADASEWNRFMGVLRGLMDKKVVKPIPYVRFDGLNIREALQHMQKAKHIGKIVCVMPELKQEEGKMKVWTPMFHENGSYLITGGLGGIGFVVCQWMVKMGAKHVLLASRRPPTPSIQAKINEMNSMGANVIAVSLDVGNMEQCKDLIENQLEKLSLPPLKGVMHAAGIIADALITNMDWAKLSSTFSTKVNGTLNLHEITKTINLEHFVVFSSMAALFGPPGQCNHAAGNAFEDALVQYRNSIGLPGTTVNWGQWGEVGVATEVDLPGVKTLSNLQGITGLEYALKTQHIQLAIFNVESFRMLSKLFPQLAIYLDESIWKLNNAVIVTVKSDEFWQQYDSKSEADEKVVVVKEQLKSILRLVLKLEDCDAVNEDDNFQEMGVDSLMFVEIKNAVQALLGSRVTLNASVLKDSNSINLLAETLIKIIEGDQDGNEAEPPTLEQVKELMREDCILPENIGAKPNQVAGKIGDIKRVLLAGATGTLGPYVLKQLLNSPQINEVVCLMRGSKKESVDKRLRHFLNSMELLPELEGTMRKVRCVSGNVALPNLGLDQDVWEELSGSVDAVFNCSARVQHNEYYRKTKCQNDVRSVNIEGTKNLLQFACETRLKHFYQASSLLSVVKTDEKGRASEDWPCLGDYDGVTNFAYPVSKFVGDYLMKEAVARGIPAKVFRFPLITGESETGRCTVENNHSVLRYLFIMKNGIMSSTPIPVPMLPSDICAESSLRIFFDERVSSDIYNLGNTQVFLDQEFVSVAKKFGHHVELVEMSEFIKKVKESVEKDSTSGFFSIFAGMYSDEETLLATQASSPTIQSWIEGNEEIFVSSKIPEIIPDFYETQHPTMEYVYKDLLFVKSKGFFEKFGV